MNHEHLPDVLTVSEVCSYLRIGKNTAYALIKSGKIPAIRLMGKFIIPKKSVVDFLNNATIITMKSVNTGSYESEVKYG